MKYKRYISIFNLLWKYSFKWFVLILLIMCIGEGYYLYQELTTTMYEKESYYTEEPAIEPWAPRFEEFLARSHVKEFFIVTLIVTVLILVSIPLRQRSAAVFEYSYLRLPIKKGSWQVISGLHAFIHIIIVIGVQFGMILIGYWMYLTYVPEEAQMTQAVFLAFIRWDFLRAVYPITDVLRLIYIVVVLLSINNLYEIDLKTGERKLTTTLAIPYSDIVLTSFYRTVVGLIMISLTILPVLFFYQHYMDSKSIYTMLRIPEKKIRLNFYIENIAVSVMGTLVVFIWQTVLYLLGYFLYFAMVPHKNQPQYGSEHFPSNPFLFLMIPVCVALLLPALALLIAFAERSKRKAIFALPVIGYGGFGIYALLAGLHGYPVILMTATLLTIVAGIIYLNKVQLV